jgi:hypothetical protein
VLKIGTEYYYWWITPPRIGIDFRTTKEKRGREWIPNIEVADLVRLIRIFRHLKHERILRAVASKKGFCIAPSFDRRIRIRASEGRITLEYRDRGWENYGETVEIEPKQLPKLIATLEEGYSQYLKLIRNGHDSGRLPEGFRHKLG